MSISDSDKWKAEDIKPTDLWLDVNNARLDLPQTATQDEIREALLGVEEVIELCREIVQHRGLLHGERVIVTEEDGKGVVLEGNRRTCACQILLDHTLAPLAFRARIPVADETTKNSIALMAVDRAPTRKAAEPTITKRHLSSGIHKWSAQAQQRRIARLVKAGTSIDEISAEFAMKKTDVVRKLREFYTLERINSLATWSAKEKKVLTSPRLELTALNRFLSLKGVKPAVGFSFKDDGTILPTHDPGELDAIFAELAKAFLLPGPRGKPPENTRSEPSDVLPAIAKEVPALVARLPPSLAGKKAKRKAKSTKKSPKPAVPVFFDGLNAGFADESLVAIVAEIQEIDYDALPTAATFLVRALMEGALHLALKKTKNWGLMTKAYAAEVSSSAGKPDAPLSWVIQYCLKNYDAIFSQNVKGAMNTWVQKHHDVANIIVHSRWIQADGPKLKSMATSIRPLVQAILTGDVLKL